MSRDTEKVIKICGMRIPENIRSVAILEPDFIGIIFAQRSSRRVEEENHAEVLEAVGSRCRIVGVVSDDSIEKLSKLASDFALSAVQLHGDEGPEFVRELRLRNPSLAVWKALSLEGADPQAVVAPYLDCVDAFVFDSGSGGTGRRFDWSTIERYEGQVPYLVAGGLGYDEVVALKATSVWADSRCLGVDVNSKIEVSSGLKDVAAAKRVIEEVRR